MVVSGFLAKPDEYYDRHIDSTKVTWGQYIDNNKSTIQKICRDFNGNFTYADYKLVSFLSCVFHDIGKSLQIFQSNMVDAQTKTSSDYSKNCRHELMSFYLTYHLLKDQITDFNLCLLLLVILGHHKPVERHLRSFERETDITNTSVYIVNKDYLEYAIVSAEKDLIQYGFNVQLNKIDRIKLSFTTSEVNTHIKMLFQEFILYNTSVPDMKDNKYRSIFSLLKGTLHHCDWFGSGHNYYNCSKKSVSKTNLTTTLNKKINNFKFRKSQLDSENSFANNVILVAPTGSGKTESAMLYCLKNLTKAGYTKILYTLPTRVTCNKMYERLCNYFGEERVGLLHSTSKQYLHDNDIESPYDSMLHKTVNVTTIDRILATSLNIKYWATLESNLHKAIIVIDEVHCYDGWMLKLLEDTLRRYSKYGCKFFIMSATLPQRLEKFVLDSLKGSAHTCTLIQDTELLHQSRNTLKYVKDTIESDAVLSRIIQDVESGKRIIVCVNSVKKCKKVYSELKRRLDLTKSIMCFHSEFNYVHRREKENIVEEGVDLLVATQLIEVSLDIDYDGMYTEVAPIDSLIQRLGRINRYRGKGNTVVLVCELESSERSVYTKYDLNNTRTVLEKLDGTSPTEKTLLEATDEVYKDKDIQGDKKYTRCAQTLKVVKSYGCFDVFSMFDKDVSVVDDTSYIEVDDSDFLPQTRLIDYIKVNCLPTKYLAQFREVVTQGVKRDINKFISDYSVPLSKIQYEKNRCYKEKGLELFVDLEYTEEIGFILEGF